MRSTTATSFFSGQATGETFSSSRMIERKGRGRGKEEEEREGGRANGGWGREQKGTDVCLTWEREKGAYCSGIMLNA